MKSFLPLLFVISAHFSLGQNYLDYFSTVNQAKLEAAHSNYEASCHLFEQAFEKLDFEYARDCINAVEVSVSLKSDSLTTYFIKCALKRGVPPAYFSQKEELKIYRLSNLWNEVLKDTIEYRRVYQEGINEEVRLEINDMFKADQEIRERYYQWSRVIFRPFIGRKWKKMNEKQVQRIVEITKEHGFPGERLIGIDSPNDHEKIDVTQFSAGMPIVILLHHYSSPQTSIDSLLLKEVYHGNLNNEHFAGICDFEAHFGKEKYPNMSYFGLRQKPKNYHKSMFDDRRSQIGLVTQTELELLNRQEVMTKFWNQLK